MPHAVLLDLDRTLFDKDGALRVYGQAQFDEHVGHVRPLWRDEWLRQFESLHGRPIPKPDVYAALQRHFGLTASLAQRLAADFDEQFPHVAAAVPGAVDLLNRLRDAGVKTAIVTNGRDQFQRAKIAALGATDLVDAIVTSGGFGAKKPDPSIFHEALRLLNAEPTDAVMVGDNPALDLQPARQLGLRTVHVLWPDSPPDPGADLASDSLRKIGDYLLPIAGSPPPGPKTSSAGT